MHGMDDGWSGMMYPHWHYGGFWVWLGLAFALGFFVARSLGKSNKE